MTYNLTSASVLTKYPKMTILRLINMKIIKASFDLKKNCLVIDQSQLDKLKKWKKEGSPYYFKAPPPPPEK